jgi:DNA-binding transcriptional regulator YiaG
MTRARVLQEVRQMRFEELYGRRPRRELTMAEAAEILGITERTFRRWSGRYDAEGAEGFGGSASRTPLGAGGAGR